MNIYDQLDEQLLFKILENIYNEVYVTDKDMNIVYVSKKCFEHYALTQEEMIGESHWKFSGKYWHPTILPIAYGHKKFSCIKHYTVKGMQIITISNPVYDENGDIKYVVSVVQDVDDMIDFSIENIHEDQDLIKRKQQLLSSNIITVSTKMKKVLSLAKKSAERDIPVLILGESGTGKTMLAKYIHDNSSRKNAPFLTINCAAIPENLLESELFGYSPNAFTGASSKGKDGLITLTNNGTLFLDEIAELPLALQSKLLTVVEQQKFFPIGSTQAKEVNVRIISATNKNLAYMAKDGFFRQDLFWRLNVVELYLPSLAERKDDILPIANYYLYHFNTIYQSNKNFSDEVLSFFTHYSWPGNIRQLKNIIDRAFVLSSENVINLDVLPKSMTSKLKQQEEQSLGLKQQLEELEKTFIQNLYRQYPSSRKLAKAANIKQSKANHLIQLYCRSL